MECSSCPGSTGEAAGAQGREVLREGRTRSRSPHLGCSRLLLSSGVRLCAIPSAPEGQARQQAALGALAEGTPGARAVHAHTSRHCLCPRGGGTTRHVTVPSPKGRVSLGHGGAQLRPVCTWPGPGAAAHGAGGLGETTPRPSAAPALSPAPCGSSAEWHIHHVTGGSNRSGQNEAARGKRLREDSAS